MFKLFKSFADDYDFFHATNVIRLCKIWAKVQTIAHYKTRKTIEPYGSWKKKPLLELAGTWNCSYRVAREHFSNCSETHWNPVNSTVSEFRQ